jgi:hypothetical protein
MAWTNVRNRIGSALAEPADRDEPVDAKQGVDGNTLPTPNSGITGKTIGKETGTASLASRERMPPEY